MHIPSEDSSKAGTKQQKQQQQRVGLDAGAPSLLPRQPFTHQHHSEY
jgi:hypothetical protein